MQLHDFCRACARSDVRPGKAVSNVWRMGRLGGSDLSNRVEKRAEVASPRAASARRRKAARCAHRIGIAPPSRTMRRTASAQRRHGGGPYPARATVERPPSRVARLVARARSATPTRRAGQRCERSEHHPQEVVCGTGARAGCGPLPKPKGRHMSSRRVSPALSKTLPRRPATDLELVEDALDIRQARHECDERTPFGIAMHASLERHPMA